MSFVLETEQLHPRSFGARARQMLTDKRSSAAITGKREKSNEAVSVHSGPGWQLVPAPQSWPDRETRRRPCPRHKRQTRQGSPTRRSRSARQCRTAGQSPAYGTIGRAELAYFKMINDSGGINGRKINLISRDDGYSPPKTVEQIRKLVEEDKVAFIFQSLGDVTNAAVQRYLNDRGIPQLFLADGSSKWDDPQHFPWTMAWRPSFRTEGHIDAAYILQTKPDAKIAVLVQDSLFGKDYVAGLEEGLGDRAKTMIVKQADLPGDGLDHQFANRPVAGVRRRHIL